MSQMGRRVPQLESIDKVTGRAIYTQDVVHPGMLYAAVLRSPHAHARIKRIATSEALAVAGVHSIITAADFPGIKYVHLGSKWSDRFPLAVDRVRFFGEEVAAVAAESLEVAKAALSRIEVEYEPLSAALSVDAAVSSHAIPVHDRELTKSGKNVSQAVLTDFGDVESAFDGAYHVFDDEYEHGVVVPACMETNGTVAFFNAESGVLTLWTATQAPFFVRKEVAHVLNMDTSKVQLRSVEVGGGFGGKSKVCEQEAIASLLAIRSERPVKLVLDRSEEFLSGKTDHEKRIRVRTAINKDGTIRSRWTTLTINNGAYNAFGPIYVAVGRQRATSLYRTDTARFESNLIYTNRVPGGQYRGMGGPQIIWAIESQIDRIAEHLNIDPLQYRLLIANRSGDETPLGWKLTSCAMAECIAEVGRRIGWDEKRRSRQPFRGVGIAAYSHPSGGVFYQEGNFSNTRIELNELGKVSIYTMTADAGTWQNTIIAQLAAEVLDIPTEQICVTHMDTVAAPVDLGSAASRVTFVTGNAAVRAAQLLRSELIKVAATNWDCAEEDVRYESGFLHRISDPTTRTSIEELGVKFGPLRCDGHYMVPANRPDSKTGHGNYAAAYVFGAQAAEVEVDPATGRVRVLRVVAAQDVGKAINPTAIEGQIHGGILQGIGIALQEELIYEDGRPVNASFIDYKVPRIGDAPPIEVAIIESDEREGPLGAKAAGEPAINCAAAAIANAVADAIGIRFDRLPLTPDRVLAALEKKSQHRVDLKSHKRLYNMEVATVRALYPKIVFPVLHRTSRRKLKGHPNSAPRPLVRPSRLEELVRELAVPNRRAKIIAGGTDVFVGIKQGIYDPEVLVDITGVDQLHGIQIEDSKLRIGAATTLAELAASDVVQNTAPMLAQGVQLIATPQIRNVATVAGDLSQEKRCWFFRSSLPCYKHGGPTCPCFAVLGDNRHHSIMGAKRCAAPCPADLAPMLSALDAVVVVESIVGTRRIPLSDFYQWSGLTSVRSDEVIVYIEIPLAHSSTQTFVKFALRQGDFADASVAVDLHWARGKVVQARLALGGVAPLPVRVRAAEERLVQNGSSAAAVESAASATIYGSLPLSGNGYKAQLTVNLARQAILNALEAKAKGERANSGNTQFFSDIAQVTSRA